MPTNANSYGPYDAGAGSNITENFWRLMTRWFASTAVLNGYLNNLNPFGDSTGLQAKVDTGAAFVRGAYGEWTAVTTLGLAAVGGIAGGSERWDRLIVRNDFVNNLMQLDVLTGTAGASPNSSRPALTQSSSMWEFLLADVGPLINTTTTVTAAMVVDGRWRMTENGILFYKTALGASVASVLLPAAGTMPVGSDAEVIWQARGDTAAVSALLQFRINGDAGANYDAEEQTASAAATNGVERANAANQGVIGALSAANAPAGQAGSGRILIPNYSGATFRKGLHGQSGWKTTDATAGYFTASHSGFWRSTAAMTTLLLLASAGNLISGSEFAMYITNPT